MVFKEPDKATIKRMTVRSTFILLETLGQRRKAVVGPLDQEIKYYEDVLERKKLEESGQQALEVLDA